MKLINLVPPRIRMAWRAFRGHCVLQGVRIDGGHITARKKIDGDRTAVLVKTTVRIAEPDMENFPEGLIEDGGLIAGWEFLKYGPMEKRPYIDDWMDDP